MFTLGNTTTYTDTEVVLGEIYYYLVKANNSVGIGYPSNAVSVIMPEPETTTSDVETTPKNQIPPNSP